MTVKLPVNMPPEILHEEESKRPEGEVERLHVVPTKPDPEMDTVVPHQPEDGVRTRFVDVSVNEDEIVSPGTFVVTVTV